MSLAPVFHLGTELESRHSTTRPLARASFSSFLTGRVLPRLLGPLSWPSTVTTIHPCSQGEHKKKSAIPEFPLVAVLCMSYVSQGLSRPPSSPLSAWLAACSDSYSPGFSDPLSSSKSCPSQLEPETSLKIPPGRCPQRCGSQSLSMAEEGCVNPVYRTVIRSARTAPL